MNVIQAENPTNLLETDRSSIEAILEGVTNHGFLSCRLASDELHCLTDSNLTVEDRLAGRLTLDILSPVAAAVEYYKLGSLSHNSSDTSPFIRQSGLESIYAINTTVAQLLESHDVADVLQFVYSIIGSNNSLGHFLVTKIYKDNTREHNFASEAYNRYSTGVLAEVTSFIMLHPLIKLSERFAGSTVKHARPNEDSDGIDLKISYLTKNFPALEGRIQVKRKFARTITGSEIGVIRSKLKRDGVLLVYVAPPHEVLRNDVDILQRLKKPLSSLAMDDLELFARWINFDIAYYRQFIDVDLWEKLTREHLLQQRCPRPTKGYMKHGNFVNTRHK